MYKDNYFSRRADKYIYHQFTTNMAILVSIVTCVHLREHCNFYFPWPESFYICDSVQQLQKKSKYVYAASFYNIFFNINMSMATGSPLIFFENFTV